MVRISYYKVTIVTVVLYTLIAQWALEKLNRQSSEDVRSQFGNLTLLVIAHPDDETMFFGPTILNLIYNDKHLVILCLTDGNAEGYGKRRERELAQVVRALGPNVSLSIIRDKFLPDNMNVRWAVTRVVSHIEKVIEKHANMIQTLVTFDSQGVSGHLNHQSIYEAIQTMRNSLAAPKIKFLALKSVSIWRKYTSFLDSVTAVISRELIPSSRIFTLSINLPGYLNLKHILELHASQMVWFRYLYMMFSRYMFLNDLEEVEKNDKSWNSRAIFSSK